MRRFINLLFLLLLILLFHGESLPRNRLFIVLLCLFLLRRNRVSSSQVGIAVFAFIILVMLLVFFTASLFLGQVSAVFFFVSSSQVGIESLHRRSDLCALLFFF